MTASEITTAIIVAQSRNRVIGIDNQLPWHLPEDLKYFKSVTMGKPVVMGRKTFESIGRPLPGRTNIVITRQPDWQAEGVAVSHSLSAALQLAREAAVRDQQSEVMVIGGAQIYAEALAQTDRLYITEVDVEIEGDAVFPVIDSSLWREVERSVPLDAMLEKTKISYTFATFERMV